MRERLLRTSPRPPGAMLSKRHGPGTFPSQVTGLLSDKLDYNLGHPRSTWRLRRQAGVPPAYRHGMSGSAPDPRLNGATPLSQETIPARSALTLSDAKIRRQSRLWFVVAIVGLVLVMVSVFGKSYGLIDLAFAGFPLVVLGGAALIALSRRAQLRPTGAEAPTTIPLPAGTWLPLDLRTSLATDPAETSPGHVDMDSVHEFKLSAEHQRYKQETRFQVLLRIGTYCFMIALFGYLVVFGVLTRNPSLVVLGGFFVTFASVLIFQVRSVYRGVAVVSVGPVGVAAVLDTGKVSVLKWDDPKFGLRIIETPPEVNRLRNPPRAGTTYRLFTGPGSGVGRPPRMLTDVPAECATLILAFAQDKGIHVERKLQGVQGTMSARLDNRLTSVPPRA